MALPFNTTLALTRIATLLCLLDLLLCPAGAQVPLPGFTGDKVIQVRGIEGNFAGVLQTIADVEKTSQQSYWVVIIRSAGSGQWAARDYANSLAKGWTEHLDTERSVLIVLCVDERMLAIHGGTILQDRFGFQGQRIDREIVAPHFIPRAKELDYPGALNQLIPAIESWITRREHQWRVEAEQGKRRAHRVREEAARHLLTSRDLVKALQDDLKRYPDFKESGASGLVQLAETTEGQLTKLATRLKSSGSEDHVLAETLALEEKLSTARKNIGELVSSQSDSAIKLEQLEIDLRLEEQALQTLNQSNGVSIASANPMIDEVDILIAETRKHISHRPLEALKNAMDAERSLDNLKAHRLQLPAVHTQIQAEAAKLKPKLEAYQRLMEKRKQLGLPVNTRHAEELDNMISQRLDDAMKDRSRLLKFHERADQIHAEAQREIRTHRTKTRTIPLAFLGVLLLGLTGTAGGLFVRTRKWKTKAYDVFNPYNREVVDLLDKLDGFKRRHELLPFSSTDFTEPISGKSLLLYEQLETRQENLRQDWVKLMDKRALAEDLVETPSTFSPHPYREVIHLLGKADVKRRTEEGYEACIADLEKLEGAHKEAKRVLAEVTEKSERLDEQLAHIENAHLSIAPYAPERNDLEDRSDLAGSTMMGDPLGTTEDLEEISGELSTLGKWTETILQHHAGCTELRAKLDEARATIDKRRAGGLLLIEEEGNPDPIWEQGDAEQRETLTALDGGDHEMAEQHLHSGFGCWEEALDRIKRQQEARAFCQREWPGLHREFQRLRELHTRTQSDQTQLETLYAPASWADVARNFGMSAQLLDDLGPLLEECKASGAPETQHYFHAADLAMQARRRQDQTGALLQALTSRREAIEAIAAEAMRNIGHADALLDSVDAVVRKHHRILSKDTHNDLVELRNVQEEAEGGAQASQPHWPRVKAQLDHIDEAAEALRSQAREEIATHERFRKAMKQAEARVSEVARFLGMNRDDRALANRIYRDAATAFQSTQLAGRENHADWLRLLDRLTDIEDALTRSETLGRKDIRLAAEARSAIKRAQADLAHARSYHREGVSASTTDARKRVDTAQGEYKGRKYEDAIENAVNASRSANQALATAESRARAIRRRREESRRRQELNRRRSRNRLLGGSSIRIGGLSGSRGSGSSHRGFRRSSSGSSRSSWGSGSSQSRW